MLVHLEFNIFEESRRLTIYQKYFDKASALGVTSENFYEGVTRFINENPNLEFDEEFLKPPDFLEFCSLIKIEPKKLYDKYYRFVLSKNYSKIILDYRTSLNMSQKEFAKLIKLSPVTIGLLENNKKYPTRAQFFKLDNVMKKN